MSIFSKIGEQLKGVAGLVGEGIRSLKIGEGIRGVREKAKEGVGKILTGASQQIREALPMLQGSLSGAQRFRVGEGLTPQQAKTAQQVVSGQVKTPQVLQATIPGLTPQKSQALFGLETGQLTPTQARQSLGLPTDTSPAGNIQTRPLSIGSFSVSGGVPDISAYQSFFPSYTPPNLPPPPPPVARTGGFTGAPITGRGVVQKVAGLSTLGQAGQFYPPLRLPEDEEEMPVEEIKTTKFAPGVSLPIAPQPPTAQPPIQGQFAGAERPLPARFDEQGRLQVPTQLPSVSIATGKITIPEISDAQGIISFAAQEAGREAFTKLSQPGVSFTPKDLDDIFQVKKQEALNELQTSNPDLYNSIINPQAQVPTDEAIIGSLEEDLQGRARDILQQTPLEFLDSLYVKYGVSDLLAEINLARANILAENQAYDKMISDISEDPDFPKRLANRRINQISDIKNRNIGDMTAKLNFLSDQYTQQLNLLKLELGIFENQQEAQRDLQKEQRTNTRNQLNTLISTGAIAQFTDDQIRQWSEATGFTEQSIRQIRDATAKREQVKLEGKPKATVSVAEGSVSQRIQELANANVSQSEIRIRIKDEFGLTDGEAKSAVDEFFKIEPTVEYVRGLMAQNLTRSEIFSRLDANTNLTTTAINELLDEVGLEKVEISLIGDNLVKLARGLVKKMGKDEAIQFIDETSELTISGKKYKITNRQKQDIIETINKEYPEGRTTIQKILPWGK